MSAMSLSLQIIDHRNFAFLIIIPWYVGIYPIKHKIKGNRVVKIRFKNPERIFNAHFHQFDLVNPL
jgi:hypothetical protein